MRDEPEYSKPRIRSQVVPSFVALLIEWGMEAVPESNLRPRVVLDTWVWLPTRDGGGRSHPLLKTLCLIPEESAWQQLWKRSGDQLTPSTHGMKLEGTYMAWSTPLPTLRAFTTRFPCGYRRFLSLEVILL